MNIFGKFLNKIRSTFYKKKKIISVKHNNLELNFINNNELTLFRSLSFSNKEPETLKWINRFKKNSTFFDIGANVGLYSIYAAKLTGANVYAFEPSVLNLEILYKNIDLNKLNEKICIVPIALNNENSVDRFNMSDIRNASALSTFGKTYDQYGNNLKIISFYKTLGMRPDILIKLLNIDYPRYIKIDVDGIEHLILDGLGSILENTQSILIELTENFYEQSEKATEIMKKYNFIRDKSLDSEHNYGKTVNQIWIKNL